MIKHIVMWKLKEPKIENREKAAAALRACAGTTPGMLKYEVGLDIGTDNAPWDIALYSEFTDRTALDAYQQSPAHQQVKAVIGPLRESRAAVDYEA
jgi:quinol monooxygenase YgiN